jgi:hypothetical protein
VKIDAAQHFMAGKGSMLRASGAMGRKSWQKTSSCPTHIDDLLDFVMVTA